MTSETEETALDLKALKAHFEKVNAGIGGLPWVVEADGGKPFLRGRRGLIAAGYIATWKEFDLIAEAVSALPALIAKIEELEAAAPSRAPEALELGSSTRMTSPASRSQTPLSAGWIEDGSTPGLPLGRERYFIVAVRRAFTGKVYSFPAIYLNAFPLSFEGEGDDEPTPTTGWFSAEGDEDDALSYRPLLSKGDELVAWCPCPQYGALSGPQRSEVSPQAQGEAVAIKRTMTLNLTDEEMSALEALAKAKDMEPPTIFRHALRLYQVSHAETVNGPIPRGPLGLTREGLVEVRAQLFALCEDTMERTSDGLTAAGLNDHEQGYLRGRKYEAKSIARAMGDVFREQLSKLKENGLSREGLGGSAQSQPGSDAQERSPDRQHSDGWPNLGNSPPDPEWLVELIRALGAVPLHNEHVHINFNGEIVRAGRVIEIAQRQLLRLSPVVPQNFDGGRG